MRIVRAGARSSEVPPRAKPVSVHLLNSVFEDRDYLERLGMADIVDRPKSGLIETYSAGFGVRATSYPRRPAGWTSWGAISFAARPVQPWSLPTAVA